jgi:hypothetical protein
MMEFEVQTVVLDFLAFCGMLLACLLAQSTLKRDFCLIEWLTSLDRNTIKLTGHAMRIPAVLAALLTTAALIVPAQAGNVRGVVEIFTSQGCSSCPPADRAFGAVTNQAGVLGLAWHVDYWDYLGWRDTFSSAQATARQAAYGKGSFTPEVIVNGSRVISQSSSSGAIASALGGSLPVNVSISGGKVNVGAGSGHANLVLVKFYRSKTVAIQRGENAGKSVSYQHPVIGSRQIGSWNGKAMTLDLGGECGGGVGCAVLLQIGVGRILGAATL